MLPENVFYVAGIGCRAGGLETRDGNFHGLSFQSREHSELPAARCCWIHAATKKACVSDGKISDRSFDDNSHNVWVMCLVQVFPWP